MADLHIVLQCYIYKSADIICRMSKAFPISKLTILNSLLLCLIHKNWVYWCGESALTPPENEG